MTNPTVGQFCWNELATPNVHKAKEFYSKLLGWEFSDHDVGEMTYTMIKSHGNEFGGMWQIPTEDKDNIPPHWMGYILVENIDKTLHEAQKHGATVKIPVTKAGDMGRFTVVVDPTGAHIAFWQSNQ